MDKSELAFLLRDLNSLILGFGMTGCDTRFRLIVDTVTFDDVVADSLVILLVVRPSALVLGPVNGCWECMRNPSGIFKRNKTTFRGLPTLFLDGAPRAGRPHSVCTERSTTLFGILKSPRALEEAPFVERPKRTYSYCVRL